MHLVDRANNCLSLLLSEAELKDAEVAFVSHSFGGLITVEILRVAQARATSENDVAGFLQRVRRLAFLGTPHLGADLASWGGRLALLSGASRVLPRNDPHLRGLNQWFRRYVTDNGVDTLTLTEARKTGWFGQIVKPDSADFGLSTFPIPVDADHFSIAAPVSRNSEVYRHVREFLTNSTPPIHPQARLVQAVESQTESITQLKQQNAAGFERLERRLADNAANQASTPKIPQNLVDGETNRRLLVLLKSRFFGGGTSTEEASRLANDLLEGEFEATSALQKAEALAWCSRLLLVKSDRTEAVRILETAHKLAKCDAIEIAEAFKASYEGNQADALARLAKLNTRESRSAAFIILTHSRTPEEALRWLFETKTDIAALDADGKFFVLNSQLKCGKWTDALNTAGALEEDDFQRAPVLLYVAAGAFLAQAVPDELRAEVLSAIPFEASQFPLSSVGDALAARRTAQDLYTRASKVASQLGSSLAANEASDRALWLALRDEDQRQRALAELESSMRDPAHALRRLSLALEFRLKLDLKAVENEIERQNALSGGKSFEAALARLAMVFTKKEPREAAEYIEKHRDSLVAYINPTFLASIELQMLVKSGQIQLAEERLKTVSGSENPEVLTRLQRLISEARGRDPIEAREELFKESDTLTDLANLIALLEQRCDWARLVKYGQIFFERSHDLNGCRLLAQALYEVRDYEGAVSLLDKNRGFLTLSDSLLSLFAWSLYWLGDVKQASQNLEKLMQRRDDANDRKLALNLALASGDWNSLNLFVEKEWERRASRTAEELLRAGQLAQQLGSARSKQLVQEAATRGDKDAAILLGSYSTAVSGGWEDNPDVHLRLAKAAAQSGEDGPVQRVSLQEIMERQPAWQRREKQTWESLHKGDAPIFVAAHLLNRTLVEFFLFPALSNPAQADPRRRGAIYAYSGVRQSIEVQAKTLALDPASLLTFGLLRQLDKIIQLSEKIVIPHSTMGWLFEERQRVQFHQPSQISDAKEIRWLLAADDLKKFESTATIDDNLSDEVGEDLAAMLSDAKADFGADKRQRVVVRPGPVHRIGSLMEEEADLSAYYDHLCSCAKLVEALHRQGQLTEAEAKRARDYLTIREKPWPHTTEIKADAVLYLDELAVTYLQHLGLLPKLRAAGFTAVLSPAEISQGDRFIQYENLSIQVIDVIEVIRTSLAEGIASGKVVLARTPKERGEDLQDERIRYHPGLAVMELAAVADAIVIDDRYFNQHKHISGGFGQKPVYTSYDLFTGATFAPAEQSELVTALRRAGFCFVPMSGAEVSRMLCSATFHEKQLVENAELKAVRESLLIARMANSLQIPKEGAWLDNLIRTFLEAIRLQWQENVDFAQAQARSNWLVGVFDVRGWAQRTNPKPQIPVSEVRYRAMLLSLSLAHGIPPAVRDAYRRWFEEELLKPIKECDAELYQALVEQVRSHIIDATSKDGGDDRSPIA
jgi:hypothetical protein